MNMTQAVVQHNIQIEHPDRVSWYQTLIQEWTGQVARVFVQADGMVAAWVMSYSSQVGIIHPAPTQVWSDTIENALDALACQVYDDVQDDLAYVGLYNVASGMVVASR